MELEEYLHSGVKSPGVFNAEKIPKAGHKKGRKHQVKFYKGS